MTAGTGWPPDAGPPQGVTRWRKKPTDVDMIRWDGSEAAWQLLANHGALPQRLPDGSVNIWVDGTDDEANLDPGDWAVIDPEGAGVFPCKAADHAGIYEAASDHVPVSPPDLHRLVSLALAVTDNDAAFVERMRAASEGGDG